MEPPGDGVEPCHLRPHVSRENCRLQSLVICEEPGFPGFRWFASPLLRLPDSRACGKCADSNKKRREEEKEKNGPKKKNALSSGGGERAWRRAPSERACLHASMPSCLHASTLPCLHASMPRSTPGSVLKVPRSSTSSGVKWPVTATPFRHTHEGSPVRMRDGPRLNAARTQEIRDPRPLPPNAAWPPREVQYVLRTVL